jgi:hypothetical protein
MNNQTKEVPKKLLEKIKYNPKYDSRLLRIKVIDSVDRYLKYILSEFDDYEKELKRKSKITRYYYKSKKKC